MFNIFYQTGILVGSLIGLLLTAVDFRVTRAVGAVARARRAGNFLFLGIACRPCRNRGRFFDV